MIPPHTKEELDVFEMRRRMGTPLQYIDVECIDPNTPHDQIEWEEENEDPSDPEVDIRLSEYESYRWRVKPRDAE